MEVSLSSLVERFEPSSAPFELVAGPFPCSVVSVRGREGISELFAFDVVLGAPVDAPVFEAGTLGQPAQLTIHLDQGPPRVVQGIASRVRRVSTRFALHPGSAATHAYRVRIVPVMWLLTRRTNSRIFQDTSVPDIVTKILGEHGVAFRLNLVATYVTRGYCVQYQETDYAFVTRILAEEGIFFTFAPPSSLLGGGVVAAAASAIGEVASAAGLGEAAGMLGITETVVLGDSAASYTALGAAAVPGADLPLSEIVPLGSMAVQVTASIGPPSPRLLFRAGEGVGAPDHVRDFELGRSVEPRAVRMRDYDFRRPLYDIDAKATVADALSVSVDLTSAGSAGGLGFGVAVNAALDAGAGALTSAGAALGGASAPSANELAQVYVHHGEYDVPDFDGRRAAIVLEQARRKAVRGKGVGFWAQMSAGHTFVLDEHPSDALNRPYVVWRVEHEGHVSDRSGATGEGAPVYKNRFTCTFAEVAVRPRRPAPRVCQAMETAVVVGPAGEEIHTDAFGRVKVQFPWDLDGKGDDKSSCWIRVSQPWAGAGCGFQFVPRVGSEVVVGFVGGDPDRPMIVGCVTNATQPPNDVLPVRKARSSIRTRSYPGGGGWNEIAFEDDAGQEAVVVRAQRDLSEEVLHDRTLAVGNDHVETVAQDRRLTVGGSCTDVVKEAHRITVGTDRIVDVQGTEQVKIAGPQTVRVDDDQTTQVFGDQTIEVIGDRAVRLSGDLTEQVHHDRTSYVFGEESRVVWRDARQAYGQACGISVATDLAVVVGSYANPGTARTTVNGDARAVVSGRTELTLGTSLVLRVGHKNRIFIDDDGVRIEAPAVRFVADTFDASTTKAQLTLNGGAKLVAKTVTVASPDGGSLALASDAKLQGASVQLGSKGSAQLAASQKAKDAATDLDTVSITLFDRRGQIIDGAPYEVSCQGYFDEGTASGGIVKVPKIPGVEKCQLRWSRLLADRKTEMDGATEDLPHYEFEMDVFVAFDAPDADQNLLRKLHNMGHQGKPDQAVSSFFAARGTYDGPATLAGIQGDAESRHDALKPIAIDTTEDA
jgi:type VI secretion system secreted protein VgrG